MRIVHAVDSLAPGGVASVLLDLATAQAGAGHEVVVHELVRGDWHGRALERGLPVVVGVPGFVRALVVGPPDVVHAHFRGCSFLSVVLGRRSRTVDHVHNLFTNLRALSFRGAAVVAVSRSVAQHLVQHYPRVEGRLSIIRNGVDVEAVRAAGEGEPRVLRVMGSGRLEEQKDPGYFLEVAAAVRELRPEVEWLWVGDGSLREQWLRRRRELDLEQVVTWSSGAEVTHEELGRLMAGSAVFVLTSRWEGLPMVALESLAVGTPVVSTEVGELNSILVEAGLGGPLPSGDAAAAARQVVEALEWGGSAQGLRDFTAEQMAFSTALAQWEDLYAALATGAAQRGRRSRGPGASAAVHL